MQIQTLRNYELVRYNASEGKVFDWKEPSIFEIETETGEIIIHQEHLYVKTLLIGPGDSIENYIEVEEV